MSNNLLKSIYEAEPGSDRVELGEAPVQISQNGPVIAGLGRARLRFQPRFTLSITADFSQVAIKAYSVLSAGNSVELTYGSMFDKCKALVTELSFDGSENSMRVEAELVPNPQRMIYSAENRKLSSVLCHVVNFPRFFSQGPNSGDVRFETSCGGWKRLGRAVLRDPPWSIEFQELEETAAIVQKLKLTGGYGITHVAKLTLQDAGSFTSQEAEAAIQNLYLFLSFVRGAWTPAVLSVGFDLKDERIYEDWGVRIGAPWEANRGWFDHNHGEALGSLYEGFRALLHDRALGKAVSSALYWYLRSNRGGEGPGIDSGIILSQAAIERLTSAYLEAHSVAMPKRSTAADLLRKTLTLLKIPTEIPSSLQSLIAGHGNNFWKDGPEALTRIRNELVHPKSKLPFKIGTVVADCWNLAQWYVELIILRLANYNGEYSNRLSARWMGEVERVPWNEQKK